MVPDEVPRGNGIGDLARFASQTKTLEYES